MLCRGLPTGAMLWVHACLISRFEHWTFFWRRVAITRTRLNRYYFFYLRFVVKYVLLLHMRCLPCNSNKLGCSLRPQGRSHLRLEDKQSFLPEATENIVNFISIIKITVSNSCIKAFARKEKHNLNRTFVVKQETIKLLACTCITYSDRLTHPAPNQKLIIR